MDLVFHMIGSRRKRPQVGDVFEIRTSSGLGYAQYAAADKTLGPRIRVLPGVFVERPNVVELASRTAMYHVHLPVGAAMSRGLITLVGHAPVPLYSGAEGEAFRLQEIWNDTLLAEQIASGWSPV